jgi:hypothetical protein
MKSPALSIDLRYLIELKQRFMQATPGMPFEVVLRYPGRYNVPVDRTLITTSGMLLGYQGGMGGIASRLLKDEFKEFWAVGVRFAEPRQIVFIDQRIDWKALYMAELQTLASIPSRKNTKILYTVKQNPETREISCDCPGWIYSKREPRSCRHTLVFNALMSSESIRPGDPILTPPGRLLTDAETEDRLIAEGRLVAPTPPPPPVVPPAPDRRPRMRRAKDDRTPPPLGSYWITRVTSSVVRIEEIINSRIVRVMYQDGRPATNIEIEMLQTMASADQIRAFERSMMEAIVGAPSPTRKKAPAKAAQSTTVMTPPGVRLRTIVFEDEDL